MININREDIARETRAALQGTGPFATAVANSTISPNQSSGGEPSLVSFDTWNSNLSFIREAGGVGETVDRGNRESYNNYASQWNAATPELRRAMENQHGFNPNRPDLRPATPSRPRSGGGGGSRSTATNTTTLSGQDFIEEDEIRLVDETADSEIFTMADQGDAVGTLANASTATATTTGPTATAASPSTLIAPQMEAEEVSQAATLIAANGSVSEESQASIEAGTLSGIAGVAQRDLVAEAEALAETPEFLGNQESFVVAEVDEQPVEVQAQIAELDPNELVSNQIESLVGSLDDDVIPVWARPAVDAVNRVMASRGLSSSTIGRNELYSAIISSAIPIAQSNAQAVQNRANQNLANRQQATIAEAEFTQQLRVSNLNNRQTAALQNAALQGNIDLAQFNAAQQTALANSNFAQTMTNAEFNAQQQSIIQNATSLASMDLANLDAQTRISVQNAQAFLAMDMANLDNDQQARVVNQQAEQQTLLSNQSATNAARQFNAASQSQTDQFMADLASRIEQFNATQRNAMEQFNVSEVNRVDSLNAESETRTSIANSQILSQISQFNASLDQQREQFNVANQQAVSQADVTWRRQANTINTAALNQSNQINVQNAFSLTAMEQQAFWQAQRDAANNAFQGGQSELNRQTALYTAAINSEATGGTTASTQRLMQSIGTTLGI